MAHIKNSTLNESDQIRREIDRTRAVIDRKLDALEARMTPREMGTFRSIRFRPP
jgi:hypothetical protein